MGILSACANFLRLARAGIVMASVGARAIPDGAITPLPLRLIRIATWPIRVLAAPFNWHVPRERRVGVALARLGPSYIKLGQFLATRPDVIGPALADDLRHLQDRLPPFPQSEARAAIEATLGGRLEDHRLDLGPSIAAASIAQVHKGVVSDGGGKREVAVKILRPGVERRFARDLSAFRFAARSIERLSPPSRRLRPTAVVDTLAHSVTIELDLRLEAAALSEMAENIAKGGDKGIRVPSVDWRRTGKRVLTLEWINGIPVGDRARLEAAGHDLKALGETILTTFLRHAMRDGFFHADMHQGNLIVEADGTVVAVDLGITGRLGPRERRFLAEILHGLITRDYRRAAQVHYWAGYVPPHHPIEVFAQALRAIGEPIHGRPADEISMADLLGQLFAYTEVFDMQTRPELLLLQKTMVVVEGVARGLHPSLNIWTAGEPIAREWVEANLGAAGALKDVREGAGEAGRLVAALPGLISQAETTANALVDMARAGVRLDAETIDRLAAAQSRQGRSGRIAAWVGAIALGGILGLLTLAVFGFRIMRP